jgi:flagellar secretion chaperone FliS
VSALGPPHTSTQTRGLRCRLAVFMAPAPRTAACNANVIGLKPAPRATDNPSIHSTHAVARPAMYTPRFAASPFGRKPGLPQQAGLYARVGVETGVSGASPHRLVAMLFDGFADAIAQAKGALGGGHIEAKGRAISRAARIVDEGLKASLDLEGGGPLAADLADLYAYVTLRLTQANLHNDEHALDECMRLMQPLREAWASIAPQADAPRA